MSYNLFGRIKEKVSQWGCFALFFTPFILVGLWTLFYSIYNIYKSEKSEYWNQIPATILKVEMVTVGDNDGGSSDKVEVSYLYFIGKKKYMGNKIGFGYGANSTENQEVLFFKLEKSKIILIYVNPDDETESVVCPGINNSIFGLLIFSIMWNSLISIFILPLFLKDGKNTEETKLSFKKYFGIVLIIWITGIFLLVSKSINFNIENNLKILEERVLPK
jgi:hypothetical protein